MAVCRRHRRGRGGVFVSLSSFPLSRNAPVFTCAALIFLLVVCTPVKVHATAEEEKEEVLSSTASLPQYTDTQEAVNEATALASSSLSSSSSSSSSSPPPVTSCKTVHGLDGEDALLCSSPLVPEGENNADDVTQDHNAEEGQKVAADHEEESAVPPQPPSDEVERDKEEEEEGEEEKRGKEAEAERQRQEQERREAEAIEAATRERQRIWDEQEEIVRQRNEQRRQREAELAAEEELRAVKAAQVLAQIFDQHTVSSPTAPLLESGESNDIHDVEEDDEIDGRSKHGAAKNIHGDTSLFRLPRLSRTDLAFAYYHAVLPLLLEGNITKMAERVQQDVGTGHGRLHWLLGVLHANGLGVPQSDSKALLHYTFAALDGVPEAHLALGSRYAAGNGVVENCPVAAAHYREAADAVAMTYDGAHHPHYADVGNFYLYSGDHAGSSAATSSRDSGEEEDDSNVDGLVFLADNGNVGAMVRLGHYYRKGLHGLPQDSNKALRYFNAAAKEGDAEAMGAMGQFHLLGDPLATPPVEKNISLAIRYFTKGAAAKDGVSLNGLGFVHAIGYMKGKKPVPSTSSNEVVGRGDADFETAAFYFRECVVRELRCAECFYNLGVLHLYGKGGAVLSADVASQYFWRAARAGSVLARWQLGRLAEDHDQCHEALEHYRLVTNLGSWAHPRVAAAAQRRMLTAVAALNRAAGGKVSDEVSGMAPSERGGGRLERGPDESEVASPEDPVDSFALALSDAERRSVRSVMAHALQQQNSFSPVDAAVGDHGSALDLETASSSFPVVEFLEQLMLAETGQLRGLRKAIDMLEESILVVDEDNGLSDEDAIANGWVDAENPAYAKDPTHLPPDLSHYTTGEVVILEWPGHPSSSSSVASSSSSTLSSSTSQAAWRLVSQREAKALLLRRLLLLCTAKQVAACDVRLGDFYFYGESSTLGSDLKQALQYYRSAAVRGNARACFNLGIMYQLGLGTPRSSTTGSVNAQGMHGEDETARDMGNKKWEDEEEEETRDVSSKLSGPQQLRQAVLRILFNEPEVHRRVDLHLAKRYYEEAGKADPSARHAVNMALVSLNLQWWWQYFSGIPHGLAKHLGISMPYYRPAPEETELGGKGSPMSGQEGHTSHQQWPSSSGSSMQQATAGGTKTSTTAKSTTTTSATASSKEDSIAHSAADRNKYLSERVRQWLSAAHDRSVMASDAATDKLPRVGRWSFMLSCLEEVGEALRFIEDIVLYLAVTLIFLVMLIRHHAFT